MKKKLTRKTISFFIAALLLFALLPLSVSAEGGAAVSISSASGKAGDTVTVSVNLNENPGVIAMNLNVGYDSEQLELVSVSNNGVLNGFSSPNAYGGGSYTLNWEDGLSTTNNNATGTIATMTFKLKENCDKANITVSGVGHDADVKSVAVSGSSGTITNTNPTTTTTTTTTKPTTTKPTTTKPSSTQKATTTTKRTTTTSAYTRPYNEDNTYPIDFTVPTTEESTYEIISITEPVTEYVPEVITEETTTELSDSEDQGTEKLSNTRLIIIVLFVCFAIIGIGVIISMVRKSKV